MPRPKKETTDSKKQTKLADAAKTLASKTKKATKTVVEKTVNSKPAKKSAEPAAKINISLQYADKDIPYTDLIQNAKNKFQYDMGGDVVEIKDLDLYVKPDENKVYFVINKKIEGDYDL